MMFSYKQKLIICILFSLILISTAGLILPNYLNTENNNAVNKNPNNIFQNISPNTTNMDWLNGLNDYKPYPYPTYSNGDFNNIDRSVKNNPDHNEDNKNESNQTDKTMEYPNPHIFEY